MVHAISEEVTQRYALPRLRDEDFVVIDSHVGRGYGLSTPEEVQVLRDLARSTGIVLDPVYSGKAFKALCDLSRQAPETLGNNLVFIHTGGIFGLLAAAKVLTPHL